LIPRPTTLLNHARFPPLPLSAERQQNAEEIRGSGTYVHSEVRANSFRALPLEKKTEGYKRGYMSAAALPLQKRRKSIAKAITLVNHAFEARQRELLGEEDFTRLLCLERKRSERSERPFLLMLIAGGKLFATSGIGSAREQLEATLTEATRDTDVLGWYKQDATMAVLFAELCDPPTAAVSAIQTKLESAIQRQLPGQQAKIKTSFHLFPEPAASEPCGSSDLTIYPDLGRHTKSKRVAHTIKRCLDIVGSLLALILLLPAMLAIALAVKVTSKGPVLFRQTRLGQYSRPFTFLKFRSMYEDCDANIHEQYISKLIRGGQDTHHSTEDGNAVFKIKNDPRVTRVGRFLRKTSLDELPQLINVLQGEMSLVGPRPPLSYEVKQYTSWHRRRVMQAKPGITGLWQVSGRSRISFDDMVRLDLKYIEHASLLLDLKILLQTPAAILSGEGAY
jgi:lipopolysaccharide/colanic/teichoic acid biosynthesis glycosyltransferase